MFQALQIWILDRINREQDILFEGLQTVGLSDVSLLRALIKQNTIAPGLIETGWTTAILSDRAATDRRLGFTPMRRTGQPFEVAATALFLAGPGGGFVIESDLTV